MSHITIRRLASACVLACVVPGAVLAANENVIEVTTTLDKVDAFDQRCSLREALKNANTNTAFSPVADECAAGSGIKTDVLILKTAEDDYEYKLTLVGLADDGGDLDVRSNPSLPAEIDDLRIELGGDKSFARIMQQVDQQRVLENHLARTTLKHIQLMYGSADRGGGIHNVGGVMLLERVDIVENEAIENGGGIYNFGLMHLQNSDVGRNEAGSSGGGIFNGGEITIHNDGSDSAVYLNAAGSFGGGIFHASGKMMIRGGDIQQNSAVIGGSIYNLADLTIADQSVIFSNNKAALAGGAIANAGEARLLITDSRIGDGDGDYDSVSGGPGGAIANLQNASLALVNSTVKNGHAEGDGGGIYSDSTKPISIVNSRIESNDADGNGGGVFLSPAAETGSDALISRSLISSNDSGSDGGGLWIGENGRLQIANSTVSGNDVDGEGAALFLDSDGFVDALNVTIQGIIGYSDPTVTNLGELRMLNSILSAVGSNGTVCDPASNPVISLGHNLSSDASCDGLNAVGDMIGVDPLLAPLGDNGGSTQTHALQGFSPAIDAGDAQGCVTDPVAGVDQRGATRPFNEGCDIGAHEQGAPIVDGIFADGFEA